MKLARFLIIQNSEINFPKSKKLSEQIIDIISEDKVLFAGYSEEAKERAKSVIETWKKFIEEKQK